MCRAFGSVRSDYSLCAAYICLIGCCSHCPWVWNCGTFLYYWLELNSRLLQLGLITTGSLSFSWLRLSLVYSYLTISLGPVSVSVQSSPIYSLIFFYKTSHRLRIALLRHSPASSPQLCAALQPLTCSSFPLLFGRLSSLSGPLCCSLHSSSKLHVK